MSIENVAKYAGVSTTTVSRVLNSVPVVSSATVQAVRAAILALNYDPAEPKRGPRPRTRRISFGQGGENRSDGKVGMIGLMTVGRRQVAQRVLRSPVINAVVESVTRAAKQNGVQLLLDDMQTMDEVTAMIRDRVVEGAVVLLADGPMDSLAVIPPGTPVVWAMGGQAGPLPVDHVTANNIAIGYLAHQYLHRRGCTDIAFLTADPIRRFSQQRRYSLAGACAEAGHRSLAFVVGTDPVQNDLYGRHVIARPTLIELVDAFVATSPRPTGLFIDRDATTAQVYPLLLQQGIQPGRDVTIVSCDHEEVRISALYPRPATIELGTDEIGDRAVRRLLLRIANPDQPPVFIQAMPRLVPGVINE